MVLIYLMNVRLTNIRSEEIEILTDLEDRHIN